MIKQKTHRSSPFGIIFKSPAFQMHSKIIAHGYRKCKPRQLCMFLNILLSKLELTSLPLKSTQTSKKRFPSIHHSIDRLHDVSLLSEQLEKVKKQKEIT